MDKQCKVCLLIFIHSTENYTSHTCTSLQVVLCNEPIHSFFEKAMKVFTLGTYRSHVSN